MAFPQKSLVEQTVLLVNGFTPERVSGTGVTGEHALSPFDVFLRKADQSMLREQFDKVLEWGDLAVLAYVSRRLRALVPEWLRAISYRYMYMFALRNAYVSIELWISPTDEKLGYRQGFHVYTGVTYPLWPYDMWDDRVALRAARKPYLPIVQWMHRAGYAWTEQRTLADHIRLGLSMPVLQYMIAIRCEIGDPWTAALDRGDIELLEWLHGLLGHFGRDAFLRATRTKNLEVFKWVCTKEETVLVGPVYLREIIRYGTLPVLQWLLAENRTDVQTLRQCRRAAERYALCILDWIDSL